MNYVPRGSMCAHCAKSRRKDCKDLPFERMPFSKKYAPDTVAVVCTEFQRRPK